MARRWVTISKQSYSGALTWIKAVRMNRRGKKLEKDQVETVFV